MKKAAALAVILLAASFLSAAEPLKIGGDLKVPRDKIVRLVPQNVEADAAILWDVFPEEAADIEELPDGRLLFTGPPGTYKVKLRTIRGKSVQTARYTVVIGDVPPTPVPPGPDPKPVPPAPVANVAFALVVEETASRDLTIARVLMDQGWTTLGISYRFYDKDSAYAQSGDVPKAVASAGGVPALILLDKTGQVLKAVKLPGTFAEVKGLVKP